MQRDLTAAGRRQRRGRLQLLLAGQPGQHEIFGGAEDAQLEPVTLRREPTGPARSGRPDGKLREPRRATAPALRPASFEARASRVHLRMTVNARHEGGLPYPPAVGVWIMIASPASITVASQPCSFSIRPSLRRTQFSPICPSPPPAKPNGGTRRW